MVCAVCLYIFLYHMMRGTQFSNSVERAKSNKIGL